LEELFKMMTTKKTLLASSVALALGAPVANAALVSDLFGPYNFSTDSANFTMLNASGGTVGGSNDVNMTWDGNGYSASSDYTGPGSASNVTASSTTTFFGNLWTAHDIQVFVPGSYSFDVTLGGGAAETGTLNATVPVGGIGMHMLFDWGGNNNIDVFVVAAPNSVFGAGIGRSTQNYTTAYGGSSNHCDDGGQNNCLYDGKGFGTDGKPAGDKVWMLATVDGDADGVMGIPMPSGGPFQFFNAGFNATMTGTPDSPVPVPAAAWLFGSGLMGLVGVARRRKSS